MIELARIRGIVPPLVTPFQADGKTVHERGLQQLVERLVGQGCHGIFVGGTTGETWALDEHEWERLVRCGVEVTAGRVPFYAGVSHPSTAIAAARARRAEELGADVVVSLAPYYIPPSQANIVEHFRTLAQATSLPVLIYQFPGIVKTSINLATYQELADIPGIAGVKDSQADVTEFRRMIDVLRSDGRDFRMFLGTDTLTDVTVLIGGQGTVPSIGNLAGSFLVEAYEASVTGDWSRAGTAQAGASALKAIYGISRTGSIFDGLIPGLKRALELLGVEAGPPAPPLRPCDAEQTRAVEAVLHKAGLL